MQSALLAEALKQARAGQQSCTEDLLLHIPPASTAQLRDFLQLTYSPDRPLHTGSLDELKSLADIAALLECKRVLKQIEVAVIKSSLVTVSTVVPTNVWAARLGMSTLDEYTARFIVDNHKDIGYSDNSAHSLTVAWLTAKLPSNIEDKEEWANAADFADWFSYY